MESWEEAASYTVLAEASARIAPYPRAMLSSSEAAAAFPQLALLEACWRNIRAECVSAAAVRYGAVDPVQAFGGADWRVTMLIYMHHETRHMAANPRTAQLLRHAMERGLRVRNAFFSALGPRTSLAPHVGVMSSVLRYHLGLVCPGGAWLEVDGQRRAWQNGQGFVWNDMFEHSAHNDAPTVRAILFLDLVRTDMSAAETAIDAAAVACVCAKPEFHAALARF